MKDAAGEEDASGDDSGDKEAPLAVSLLSKGGKKVDHFLGAKHLHLLPEGAQGVPDWAKGCRNGRGVVSCSPMHYSAVVRVQ